MAKGEKLLEKMRQNPIGWRIAQVATVCRSFGIACNPPSKGSHYKLSLETQVEILTIPAHRPIKAPYIRDLIDFVDAVRSAS